MNPVQDSHTTMRHSTAPQKTKPSSITWCRPGRASGIEIIAPRTSRNHSCGPKLATGRQDYTREGVATK